MLQPDPTTWVRRCADRLHAQWSTIPLVDLEDVALDLIGNPQLRQLAPEDAAAQWLKQGVAAGE